MATATAPAQRAVPPQAGGVVGSVLCAGLLAAALLAGGCSDRAQPLPDEPAASDAPPIKPAEMGKVLQVLARQIVDQVDDAATRIDEADPRNTIRRATLAMRIRAAEVCLQAGRRHNSLLGGLELWFWFAALERSTQTGTTFGAGQPIAESMAAQVHAQASDLVRRSIGTSRWRAFRAQIDSALHAGVRWQANTTEQEALVAKLLEQSRLESILAIPLSPFSALAGVGKGGDALADLVVVGDRAVMLGERYPELVVWNLRAMILDIEDHDAVRDFRRNIDRVAGTVETLGRIADALPQRMREETVTLIESTREAQGDLRATLAQAERTAAELRGLAGGVSGIMELGRDMARSATLAEPAGPPGRPFDVRDYETALAQAATTAVELRRLIHEARALIGESTGTGAAAVDARLATAVAETRGLVDHIAWRVTQILAGLLIVVIGAWMVLRRRG